MTRAERKQHYDMYQAIHIFAEAWAEWHNHSAMMLDDDLISACHDLLPTIGLEMVEISGAQMIVETPTKKRKAKAP